MLPITILTEERMVVSTKRSQEERIRNEKEKKKKKEEQHGSQGDGRCKNNKEMGKWGRGGKGENMSI